jgi:hypothetical protein
MFSLQHGLFVVSLAALSACERNNPIAPAADSVVTPTYATSFTIDSLIGQTRDTNGYWHLRLNRGTLQTTARVKGTVSWTGPAVNTTLAQNEAISVYWESDHTWVISDSIAFIVRRPCLAPSSAICVYVITNRPVLDTIIVPYFAGQEVATVNGHSYSSSTGEVNTMIAPVVAMAGDTMEVTGHAMFRNGVEIIKKVKIVLE